MMVLAMNIVDKYQAMICSGGSGSTLTNDMERTTIQCVGTQWNSGCSMPNCSLCMGNGNTGGIEVSQEISKPEVLPSHLWIELHIMECTMEYMQSWIEFKA